MNCINCKTTINEFNTYYAIETVRKFNGRGMVHEKSKITNFVICNNCVLRQNIGEVSVRGLLNELLMRDKPIIETEVVNQLKTEKVGPSGIQAQP